LCGRQPGATNLHTAIAGAKVRESAATTSTGQASFEPADPAQAVKAFKSERKIR
jgi:hypothetical protein